MENTSLLLLQHPFSSFFCSFSPLLTSSFNFSAFPLRLLLSPRLPPTPLSPPQLHCPLAVISTIWERGGEKRDTIQKKGAPALTKWLQRHKHPFPPFFPFINMFSPLLPLFHLTVSLTFPPSASPSFLLLSPLPLTPSLSRLSVAVNTESVGDRRCVGSPRRRAKNTREAHANRRHMPEQENPLSATIRTHTCT